MENLRKLLAGLQPGPIADASEVEHRLAACWDDLRGDYDGGMKGYKLLRRMEEVVWRSPVLTFVIERHGGTVNGSTRAELQHWCVNIEEETATLSRIGRRQLYEMAPRIGKKQMRALAEEIAEHLIGGVQDERIVRKKDGSARVVMTRVFPGDFNRTRSDRSKRLRGELAEVMGRHGWGQAEGNVYKPCEPAVLSG
jgi:hypothetical protein